MWKAIGSFFKSFWSALRPGMEEFLKDELQDATMFMYEIWINNGRPLNLIKIESLASNLFHQRYSDKPGTWARILSLMAWDALKRAGRITD